MKKVSGSLLCESLRQAAMHENAGIRFVKDENKEIVITYRQLLDKATGMLGYLQANGLKAGDEMVVELEDNEMFLTMFWACLLGGIIPVPISLSSNNEHKLKLFKIWQKLNKPHLVTNQKFLNMLEEFTAAAIDLEPIFQDIKQKTLFIDQIECSKPGTLYSHETDGIAFIQFSSGSTGDPKGIVLTHQNLNTNIESMINGAKINSDDITLSWMPLTHDMGLIGFHLVPLYAAINQIILNTALFIRRPMLWMEKASQHKATLLSSPNFGYKYFLSFYKPEVERNWDLTHIRIIFNGAEPISSELCSRFSSELKVYGLPENAVYPVYGMAEASLAVTFPVPGEEIITWNMVRDSLNIGKPVQEAKKGDVSAVSYVDVGFPVDNCRVRICDAEANILEEGFVGFVHIQGNNVTKGYYNNPSADENAFTKDGWLNTEDLGFMRNGRLVVTGRAKDIIFINGQNFFAYDFERVAQMVDGVELGEVAACGVLNHQEHKDDIVLFVLFKKDAAQFIPLIQAVKKQIFQHIEVEIKEVIPVKKMPKTTSGKIQRYQLKERYMKGEFQSVSEELNRLLQSEVQSSSPIKEPKHSLNQVEEKLTQVWSKIIADQPIGINDNFMDIGGNSLLLTSFCTEIEKDNIGKVSIVDLFSYPTIRKLAQFISEKKESFFSKISLLQLKLPEQYFQNILAEKVFTGTLNKDSSFIFTIEEKHYDALIKIAFTEKTKPEIILLSLFGYQLNEISGQDEIAVQAMDSKTDQVNVIVVDFDAIEDISSLIQSYQHKSAHNETFTYFLSNLNSIKLKKEKWTITPFFYNETLLHKGLNPLNIFDISLGFSLKDNSIELIFNYDNDKLVMDQMKGFVRSYTKLIYAVISDYKKNDEDGKV